MTTSAAHRKTAINSIRNYRQKRIVRWSNFGIILFTGRMNALGMAARISGEAIKATTDIRLVSVTPRCLVPGSTWYRAMDISSLRNYWHRHPCSCIWQMIACSEGKQK